MAKFIYIFPGGLTLFHSKIESGKELHSWRRFEAKIVYKKKKKKKKDVKGIARCVPLNIRALDLSADPVYKRQNFCHWIFSNLKTLERH